MTNSHNLSKNQKEPLPVELGFDVATITEKQLIRLFHSAWLERQEYVKRGIFTGAEARKRYDRFRTIQWLLTNKFHLDASEILNRF